MILKWHAKSIIKSFKHKKFKAIFRFFYDSKYRFQIQRLYSLTSDQPLKMVTGQLPIYNIKPGHDINYPEWVKILINRIETQGYKTLDPVKVIWNESMNSYMIVDGNHRFEALRSTLSKYQTIEVNMLVPKGESEETYNEDIQFDRI